MFSPYYFRARREDAPAQAENHCAVNIALYGGGARRWTMTERGAPDISAGAAALQIGSSALEADGSRLRLTLEERTAIGRRRVAGLIHVEPLTLTSYTAALDTRQRHRWMPLAPRARVSVEMEHPRLAWEGTGYLDMNRGEEPLEAGFSSWNWCRVASQSEAAIFYDVDRRDGGLINLCLHINRDGSVTPLERSKAAPLPRTTLWRMPRYAHGESSTVRVVQTLEDTPFYSRSKISTTILGATALGMHESLSLDRFRTQVVQTMLPYRMPRKATRFLSGSTS